jgi:hypothetical protein
MTAPSAPFSVALHSKEIVPAASLGETLLAQDGQACARKKAVTNPKQKPPLWISDEQFWRAILMQRGGATILVPASS